MTRFTNMNGLIKAFATELTSMSSTKQLQTFLLLSAVVKNNRVKLLEYCAILSDFHLSIFYISAGNFVLFTPIHSFTL